jgi:hypothetical protein
MSSSTERDDRWKEAYEKVMEALPTHETMDRLTSFLYVLMRDHLPPGVVTEVAIDSYIGEGPFVLSNGYLAKFAEHLTHKLREIPQGELDEVRTVQMGDEPVFMAPDSFRTRQKDRKPTE